MTFLFPIKQVGFRCLKMVTSQSDVIPVLNSQSEIEKDRIFGCYNFEGPEAYIYIVILKDKVAFKITVKVFKV